MTALLRQLRQLLAEGDAEAADLWRQESAAFARTLPAATLHRVELALQRFDFDAALGLLDAADGTRSPA